MALALDKARLDNLPVVNRGSARCLGAQVSDHTRTGGVGESSRLGLILSQKRADFFSGWLLTSGEAGGSADETPSILEHDFCSVRISSCAHSPHGRAS